MGNAAPKLRQHLSCLVGLAESFFGDAEVAPGASAALLDGVAQFRRNQSFAFQSLQRCVDAAQGNFPTAMPLQLAGDGNSVGIVSELDQDQENHQFEFSEIATLCHFINNSEEITRLQ